MPLSAEEQRRLAELEESLSADDPGFARTFSRNAPRPRKKAAGGSGSRGRTVGCSLAIALGVVMLLAGVEKSWIISVIGFVVMLVASLALYGGLRGRRPRAGAARDKARSDHPAGGGRQSFTEKMEERWRRRSDGQR
ncbi:MAG: DUF3040 domain-containing protein [Acidipropionibacterium acidipropionici]|jgi:hypothetical protein|uniref:DUF3040 domain-containing protein n=1 Tax=Acidipropionibacterium acidipropionici TaxID=1748 RepID=A0AAC9FCI4_9ACTN|nr:DUF3040 domain-containing protein [Acidipropionibacterium acidipropionici]AMS06778.1 hypothetical protein AXH35_16325 [Acidipropionibacterium acidipropionici]AOZ45566.1 hypothetical protein A8L58_01265 [Acidipropionibacterium acidipropionici]AZP38426.1 DUF3040 domain-containing protein [Acidipropionibacterium acidipropionici]QCV95370.1 DUF3040 domain-containing protein [Acidipropionibacterium acidipropionici]